MTSEIKPSSDAQYQELAKFNTSYDNGSVKTAMKNAGAKSSDLWQVPLGQLHVVPHFNMRLNTPEYQAHLAYLEASMIANGYFKHEPMTGFVGIDPGTQEQRIYVTEGHSRLNAARSAVAKGADIGLLTIIIKDRTNTMADLTVASYHSNNSTKKYTTLETALVCLRLRENHNRETFQIAEALGLTKPYVETLLILARSPQAVRDLVQTGKVSASAAIETLKKDKATAEEKLTKAVQTAEKRVAAATVAAKPDPKPTTTAPATAKPGAPAGTVATAKPAATSTPAKKVVVTKADISPEDKVLKEKCRMGPRLYEELKRLVDVEKTLTLTPELEKIFFIIENVQ